MLPANVSRTNSAHFLEAVLIRVTWRARGTGGQRGCDPRQEPGPRLCPRKGLQPLSPSKPCRPEGSGTPRPGAQLGRCAAWVRCLGGQVAEGAGEGSVGGTPWGWQGAGHPAIPALPRFLDLGKPRLVSPGGQWVGKGPEVISAHPCSAAAPELLPAELLRTPPHPASLLPSPERQLSRLSNADLLCVPSLTVKTTFLEKMRANLYLSVNRILLPSVKRGSP